MCQYRNNEDIQKVRLQYEKEIAIHGYLNNCILLARNIPFGDVYFTHVFKYLHLCEIKKKTLN